MSKRPTTPKVSQLSKPPKKSKTSEEKSASPTAVATPPTKAELCIELPSTWSQEDAIFGRNNIVSLEPSAEQYREVEHLFRKDIPAEFAKILCIRESRNMHLYFTHVSKLAEQKNRSNGVDDKLLHKKLWHGTNVANAESICRENMDKGRVQTNVGSLYGRGIYFTWSARLAASDAYSKPSVQDLTVKDHNGEDIVLPSKTKCLLLCRVIVGNSLPISNNNQALIAPPDGYDTTCNEVVLDRNTGTVLIPKECIYSVYDTSRIYPQYIVYFEPLKSLGSFFKVQAAPSTCTIPQASKQPAPSQGILYGPLAPPPPPQQSPPPMPSRLQVPFIFILVCRLNFYIWIRVGSRP